MEAKKVGGGKLLFGRLNLGCTLAEIAVYFQMARLQELSH